MVLCVQRSKVPSFCEFAQWLSAPKTRRPANTQNLNSQFFFFKARPQHYAICSPKTHSFLAVPVGRISQGAAVFCVRNASTSRVVRSMPSRSTCWHCCDATRCRRRCSTTISTSAGSSRRRRSGASARNGDANVLHAMVRRRASSSSLEAHRIHGSSVVMDDADASTGAQSLVGDN